MTAQVEAAPGEHARAAMAVSPVRSLWTTLLFATTSFVGAALLFVVQPLIARLVLPYFGGSATVWSTSSLFFQVLLLLGYLYVHISTVRLGRRWQPLVHFGVLLLPLLALPVALPETLRPDPSSSPILWLLATLALTIGLPFVVISTTGPLLQRWYSWTANLRSEDPYFLFATSNLGSFAGLLAYPFIIEPFLTVDQQRTWWSWGFGGFLGLMFFCGLFARLGRGVPSSRSDVGTAETDETSRADHDCGRALTARVVLLWLALAFLPSTLMLGVTAHISTDVAAIPMMWVIPLAIYLATFVAAFARQRRDVPAGWFQATALLAMAAAVAFLMSGGLPTWVLIAVDLALLLSASFVAHARLAALRPTPTHLTAYFLVIAAGGALGGLLNGVAAPIVFDRVWEYPFAIAAAALLGVGLGRPVFQVLARRYHRAFVLLIELVLAISLMTAVVVTVNRLKGEAVITAAAVAVLGLVGWRVARRPVAAALAVAAMVMLPLVIGDPVLHRERTFYGSYRVSEADGIRTFTHGTTVHGTQSLEESAEPSTYYARSGPVGSVFEAVVDASSVGVVGLGVGTIAAYGEPGQSMTFFEIDPAVVEVASDTTLFTYLADSEADISHVVGDGRLMLAEGESGAFDLLFLDAFTSDAIPVHLLTGEAFEIYARAVGEDGVIMVHISNRVFDLEPVVAAAADRLGWSSAVGTGAEDEAGATLSQWIALSADPEVIARLKRDDQLWRVLGERRVKWTDDYSSVLTVLR